MTIMIRKQEEELFVDTLMRFREPSTVVSRPDIYLLDCGTGEKALCKTEIDTEYGQ